MEDEEVRMRLENVDPEKFGFVMHIHFPNIRPGQVEDLCCEVCQDFKENHCPGENLTRNDVIGCMIEKVDLIEFTVFRMDASMN